jgi:hypothetical protein
MAVPKPDATRPEDPATFASSPGAFPTTRPATDTPLPVSNDPYDPDSFNRQMHPNRLGTQKPTPK